MSDLLAARTQMAMSLGFHIIFAEIGIAMPPMMVIAEWRWRRTGDGVYLALAHRWAKGIALHRRPYCSRCRATSARVSSA